MIDKNTHYIKEVIDKDGRLWWILVDAKGNQITDYVYRHLFCDSEEGFYEVYRNNKHGHIDWQGKERIPCMYDKGRYFSEGIVSECLYNRWGCVDTYNNTIIRFQYEDLGLCLNNTICAKLNGKWGLINKFNEVLIDFIYDELNNFAIREVIAHPAKSNGKWGLINKFNDVIEDFIYDEIECCSNDKSFKGKFLKITKNNKIALYLATENCFLTDFVFDDMEDLSEGRFRIKQNGKFGYINTLGKTVVEPIYEIADCYYKDGKVVAKKDGIKFALDLYGNKTPYCKKQKPKHFISSKILEYYPIKDKGLF